MNLTNLNASSLASGTLPTARLPAFTGDVTSSAGSNSLTLATVPISKGGTGQTTANAALNALLPTQILNTGKVLQTDGTNTSWVNPSNGTVTSVTGSAPISVTNTTTTPAITIAQANTTTSGYLSSADWNTFNNKASTTALNSYVLKAGDTMTGTLTLPSNGLVLGTNQLVASGGSVGIGTASPQAKLDVAGDVFMTGGSGVYRYFRTDSDHLRFNKKAGSQNFYFSKTTDGLTDAGLVELMTVTDAGRVGIGTSAPDMTLDVAGGVRVSGNLTPSAGAGIEMIYNSNVGYIFPYDRTAGAGRDLILGNSGAGLTVKNGGNVGIGTTSPTYNLAVFGNSSATMTNSMVYNDNGTNGRAHLLVGNNGAGHINLISNRNATSYLGVAQNTVGLVADYSPMVFATGTSNSATERMRIDSSGNVGIGTANAQRILHVATNGSTEILSESTAVASGTVGRIWRTRIDPATANFNIDALNGAMSGGNSAMTMTPAGAIGIGIASPGEKLHVAAGDSSMAIFGPNATWSSYLRVGSGNSAISSGVAQVVSTNGNLHLDSGTGQDVYLQHFTGRNVFSNLNGGSMGIGTPSPNARLTVSVGSNNAITAYSGDGSYHAVHGQNQATGAWGSLGYSNYGIYCIGNCGGNTGWNNFSDRRLKEHISPLKSSLEKVTSLQGVEYDWKDEQQHRLSGHQMGLIAQDVEKVFPEAVKTDKNNKKLEGGVKSLEYTMLIAPIIEAIKELNAQVQKMFSTQDTVQREVASVKAENEKLKQENAAIKAYLCTKDPKASFCK